MLQDDSNNKEATWEFLDRRISNAMTLGQTIGRSSAVGSALQVGVQSIFNSFTPYKFDDSEMQRMKQELGKEDEK